MNHALPADQLMPAAFEQIRAQLTGSGLIGPDAETYLLGLFSALTLQKGEHLVRAGDYVPQIGFLMDGLMRHYFLRTDGTEITVDFARKLDIVGEYNNLLLDRPADHYVQALEPCLILVAPIAELRAAYDQFPALERLSRQYAEQYLHRIMTQLSQYMVRSPEERYTYLLTHELDLIRRVPQVILASYVGVTPVSLSRIRKRLATPGA